MQVRQRGLAVPAGILAGVLAVLLIAGSPADAATAKQPRTTSKASANNSKLYRWVDDDGVVHFGDQIPPEYAEKDRQVLNRHGVAVRDEHPKRTEADLAAERQAAAERAVVEAAARRDRVLLNTYLSVEEIEALRDRRAELFGGQIKVTESYLGNLENKLKALRQEAGTYKPYSSDPNAQPIDEKLAQELSDTLDSIELYRKTLADTRSRQQRLVADFTSDIARFKELRQVDEIQP